MTHSISPGPGHTHNLDQIPAGDLTSDHYGQTIAIERGSGEPLIGRLEHVEHYPERPMVGMDTSGKQHRATTAGTQLRFTKYDGTQYGVDIPSTTPVLIASPPIANPPGSYAHDH